MPIPMNAFSKRRSCYLAVLAKNPTSVDTVPVGTISKAKRHCVKSACDAWSCLIGLNTVIKGSAMWTTQLQVIASQAWKCHASSNQKSGTAKCHSIDIMYLRIIFYVLLNAIFIPIKLKLCAALDHGISCVQWVNSA